MDGKFTVYNISKCSVKMHIFALKTLVLYLCAMKLCQCYVNVALNKPTYQQYPARQGDDKYDSSNAVDGLKADLTWNGGQCVFSDGRETATWWVNLTIIYSIRHIAIYFMTGNLEFGPNSPYTSFFLGFSVYISNTTEMSHGIECYKEDNYTTNTIPAVFTTICPVHGQYVIYYNERLRNVTYPKEYSPNVHNNLCEVEVYGCQTTGYYGSNCSIPCPDVNCQYCHIETGTCQGCKPGYRGHRCELTCAHGYFGKDCVQKCNKTCNGCNTTNGLCKSGCLPGWRGDYCHKACERGSYGIECNETCGHCRDIDQCSNSNGTCLIGCNAGYQGDLCTKPCDRGLYGVDCSESCGNCLDLTQCSSINGNCLTGCVAGYNGDLCKTQCSPGSYGANCLQKCGQCRGNSTCNMFDGSCPDGCSAGYIGSLCSENCEPTFYGINCTLQCNKYCYNHACDHVTGECIPPEEINNLSIRVIRFGLVAVFIILLIFLIFFCRRRKVKTRKQRKEKENDYMAKESTSNKYENVEETLKKPPRKSTVTTINDDMIENDDIDIDEKIHRDNPYENISLKEEPIADFAVTNLDNVIKNNSDNGDDGFKKEYARLLYGKRYDCSIGKLPENIPKNRFKSTFPYDHSRVIFDDSSDYINANYIDGLVQENAYIATQGPKQKTVNDFWKMVWQKNVVQIVMLTNLMEGTKRKCARYWPTLDTCMNCKTFKLEMKAEKQYAYYVIRMFEMTSIKENKTRTITQYHYIAWPDHGVPDPLCLLSFHNHVTRTKTPADKEPTLVHCSAGIGRTGTYIAIDALYKEVQQQNKINIAKYVTKMREKRMNMVQTFEQYKTIFLTLYEMSKAPATVQKPTEFIGKLETTEEDSSANVSSLRDEFQKLMSARPQPTDNKMVSEVDGMSTTIRQKGENVITLNSSVPKRGSNIDGIFIHSFTNQNAFIVTNCQPADDVVDFLRLITDYDSKVVVFMEPLNNIDSIDTWMPTTSSSSKSVPPFTIQLQQENTKENKWHKVEITKENTDFKPRMVHLAAPTHDIPSDYAQTASQILGLVLFARNIMEEGPIIVVSKDGTALCGVFCAVYNLIQQLTIDEEIDVFSVVRLLQTRRPELCGTMEEYDIINLAIMTFIQSRTDENTYCNQ